MASSTQYHALLLTFCEPAHLWAYFQTGEPDCQHNPDPVDCHNSELTVTFCFWAHFLLKTAIQQHWRTTTTPWTLVLPFTIPLLLMMMKMCKLNNTQNGPNEIWLGLWCNDHPAGMQIMLMAPLGFPKPTGCPNGLQKVHWQWPDVEPHPVLAEGPHWHVMMHFIEYKVLLNEEDVLFGQWRMKIPNFSETLWRDFNFGVFFVLFLLTVTKKTFNVLFAHDSPMIVDVYGNNAATNQK